MASLSTFPDGPRGRVPEMRNGYKFLRAAHHSVSGLLDAVGVVSAQRRASNATTVGRLAGDEIDLLRAAIVFTSSGLDASMTRLVNDVARHLILLPRHTAARGQYEGWIKTQMGGVVPEPLRTAVIAREPAEAVLRFYLAERTKASFQGSGDLIARVRNALGIPKNRVTDATLKSLDPFFEARNKIVHSMDFLDPENSAGSARKSRSADEVATLCDGVFTVACDLMHATAEVMVAARRP